MHVLLVEDSPAIRGFLLRGLQEEGHRVRTAGSLSEARAALADEEPDVLVLDRMLPDGEGLGLLGDLRRGGSRLPVLCLTARDRVEERVEGLRAGADDYLVKPFAFDELLARLEALTRREHRGERIELGDILIDVPGHRVERAGELVELTSREFDLLLTLARSVDRVVSRTRLLEQVWDIQFDPGTNRVDVYVGYLRKKLGAELIETVRGVGYVIRRP